MSKDYGHEILGARSAKRVNQMPLAKRANIYRATLIDIESGRIGVDEETRDELMAHIEALAKQRKPGRKQQRPAA